MSHDHRGAGSVIYKQQSKLLSPNRDETAAPPKIRQPRTA